MSGLVFVIGFVGGVGGVGMTVEIIEVEMELKMVLRETLHLFRAAYLFAFIFVIGSGGVRVGC